MSCRPSTIKEKTMNDTGKELTPSGGMGGMTPSTKMLQPGGIIPQTLQDVELLAVKMQKSKIAPKSLDTKEKLEIALLMTLEVGL